MDDEQNLKDYLFRNGAFYFLKFIVHVTKFIVIERPDE